MTEGTDRPAEPADEVPVRHVHPPQPAEEETIDAPVLDGAEELQAEAEAAVESGEVDLSDTRLGGPTVVDEPGTRG